MKLSIITINYNNLEGLKKTADSILQQTWTDWEWIVIDGKSSDGSYDFIKQHENKIAYWCSEPDKGVYNAMNKGIRHAQGDYLIFMNSGDSFYDNEILNGVFSLNPQEDVLYGDWIQLFKDRNQEFKIYAPKEFSLYFIINDNICHQAIFVKRSLLQQKGYDERYRLYADWAKWIELTLQGCSFRYVPFTICYYEMGGLSCQLTEYIEKEKRMLQEALPQTMRNLQDLLNRLWEYENNKIIQRTMVLTKKRKFYKRLLRLNVGFVNLLSRIFN